MKYKNPVVKGFYPDPSVCFANGKFYMVCSSFQYFPGVPLFESDTLINWKQIGYVLTRPSQVMLDKVNSSGGIFAPTIRYHNGRFYMVTTNDTTHEHFYVYTDNIYGEWSEPIVVKQNGIDPSLLFDDGHVYFQSNGSDDYGENGIVQCEIDIETGKKRSPSKCIWHGNGGRFLESPHIYKINGTYYLLAAEGGTEYGHMIIYARSQNVWGEFENYPENPVLTNRNKAPYCIQGIGHGDLIQNQNGDWFIVSLGFRQIHLWQAYHHLGREVFLTPVQFHDDGWFTAGTDGTTDECYEITGNFVQNDLKSYRFDTTDWNIDWSYLRKPVSENYELSATTAKLHGSPITLNDVDSPTFIALRQRDFQFVLTTTVKLNGTGEGGLTVYHTEQEHYDLAVIQENHVYYAILKLNIGGIRHEQSRIQLTGNYANLVIKANAFGYHFSIQTQQQEIFLGYGQSKYLSSEVCNSFTGVMLGLYTTGNCTAVFRHFELKY